MCLGFYTIYYRSPIHYCSKILTKWQQTALLQLLVLLLTSLRVGNSWVGSYLYNRFMVKHRWEGSRIEGGVSLSWAVLKATTKNIQREFVNMAIHIIEGAGEVAVGLFYFHRDGCFVKAAVTKQKGKNHQKREKEGRCWGDGVQKLLVTWGMREIAMTQLCLGARARVLVMTVRWKLIQQRLSFTVIINTMRVIIAVLCLTLAAFQWWQIPLYSRNKRRGTHFHTFVWQDVIELWKMSQRVLSDKYSKAQIY